MIQSAVFLQQYYLLFITAPIYSKKQKFKFQILKKRVKIKKVKPIQIITQDIKLFNKQNQQIKQKEMIKTRNQNKAIQLNQIQQKLQKKKNKNKNQNIQTDLQNQKTKLNPLKIQNIAPSKSKKFVPKLKLQYDPRHQVQEYQSEIIQYLKLEQRKYKINQHYLKFHQLLSNKIRSFLVKFMFKIVWKYKCKRSTLYLAVYCMDFYLSKISNINSTIDVITVGQASLHIAMKYEEIYPIQLKQWTSDAEQIKKVLSLEAQILKTTDYNLNFPSIYYFQQYFQKKFFESERYKQNKENLYLEELKINLISDLCLFDVSLYEYQPYQLAKNIRILVYNISPPFSQDRLALNIKWALERNKAHLDWLKEIKYKELI